MFKLFTHQSEEVSQVPGAGVARQYARSFEAKGSFCFGGGLLAERSLLYLAPPVPFRALRAPPLFTLIRFFCADHQYLGQSGWALEVIVAVALVTRSMYEDFEHDAHIF